MIFGLFTVFFCLNSAATGSLEDVKILILIRRKPIMNEKSFAVVERVLTDLLKKTQRESDYFRGRLIQAESLILPKQHMIDAAIDKVNRYEVEISEIEGELEMLREEFGMVEDPIQEEELGGE